MTHKNDGFIENLMKVPAPLKNRNLKKLKEISRRLRDSTKRPKIGCLRRKGYRKNEQRLRHAMLHSGRI